MLGARAKWTPISEPTCQKKIAVGFVRTSKPMYQRSDARKLGEEKKNDPETRETSPGGEPFSHPGIPRMIDHKDSSTNKWATSPLSEGYIDDSDALRQAIIIAEMRPKWDFSIWDHQTQLAYPAEETEAIQQYGVEIQRRAYEIVCELQEDQRDAAEASRAQIEGTSRMERGTGQREPCPTI